MPLNLVYSQTTPQTEMNKSKAAFLFSSQVLGKQQLYLWTFTFKDLLGVKETRKRWNHLLTLLLRTWPNLQGLRVFELHEEHGLHVHLATNQFIDVNRARELAHQSGWGGSTSPACRVNTRRTWRSICPRNVRHVFTAGASGPGSARVGNGLK